MRALILVVAGLTLGAACSSNRVDATGPLREGAASLDDTVTVTLGKSALTRDGAVRVSFLEKLADSRCGIDVLDPKRFVLGDYEISLIDMVPYPGDRRNVQTAASVRVFRSAH
jgi:hypothetical protein